MHKALHDYLKLAPKSGLVVRLPQNGKQRCNKDSVIGMATSWTRPEKPKLEAQKEKKTRPKG